MTHREVLERVLGALGEAGIPYMLTGSFASAYHGVPRATQDIDLVIAPTEPQLELLVSRFRMPEYYVDESAAVEAYRQESQFNLLDLVTGWKIDLIIRKSRPFSRGEFERRVSVDFEGLPISIARAEDLIVAKLEWAKAGESARQLEDVAGILRVRSGDLDHEYIQRWVSDLGLDREWETAEQKARS